MPGHGPAALSQEAADGNLVTHMTWVQSRLPGGHVELGEDLVLSDSGLPCDSFNFVCRARMNRGAAAAAAARVVKYFTSNAGPGVPLTRIVRAAFARWNVEHAFRLAKGEAGLSHYEGRSYVGLMRHLVLCLVVLGFVAVRAAELRGEKPGGDGRAGVPGAQRPVRRGARSGSRRSAGSAHG